MGFSQYPSSAGRQSLLESLAAHQDTACAASVAAVWVQPARAGGAELANYFKVGFLSGQEGVAKY